jgi:hypothetical protein
MLYITGVHESNAACSTLLDESDMSNSMPRIIKRCELIQCTVETLADQFEQLLNDEIQSTFPRSKSRKFDLNLNASAFFFLPMVAVEHGSFCMSNHQLLIS